VVVRAHLQRENWLSFVMPPLGGFLPKLGARREWRVTFAAPLGRLRACSIAFDLRLRLDASGSRGFDKMRILGIVALAAALGGCAFQRAEVAQTAQASMIGMPKEQVLACMGAPANKAAEGKTEVWGYNSGNGMTVTDASYGRFGGTAVSSNRFCNVNIVMTAGLVSAVNYTGPTGGLLTAGEQCAYAVNACVKHQ
jgi:hypothetical protein